MKYAVSVEKWDIIASAMIFVEADNEEEAKVKALEEAPWSDNFEMIEEEENAEYKVTDIEEDE